MLLLLLVQVKEKKEKQQRARGFVLKWKLVVIDVYLGRGIKLVAKSRPSVGFNVADVPETRGHDLGLVSVFQNNVKCHS